MSAGMIGTVRWSSRTVTRVALASLAFVAASAATVEASSTRPPDGGAQVFNVEAFGAVADDGLDDAAAIRAADNAASYQNGIDGGLVFFPGGTYTINSPLEVNADWLGSGPGSTIIDCPVSCGTTGIGEGANQASAYAGVPALKVNNFPFRVNFVESPMVRGLTLQGPGQKPAADGLGVPTAGVDGVALLGYFGTMEDVEVRGFDAGIVIFSQSGHTSLRRVTSSANYFGIYDVWDYYDVYIQDSDLSGNTMAGFGYGPTFVGTLYLQRVDLGQQPYGIYGALDAGSDGFAFSVFDDVSFEGMGNGAIYSERSAVSATTAPLEDPLRAHRADGAAVPFVSDNLVGGLDLRDVTFSWDPAKRIQLRPRDYAISLSTVQLPLIIRESPELPFTAGDKGVAFVGRHEGSRLQGDSWYWQRPVSPPASITVRSGRTDTIAIQPSGIADGRGLGVIPAGHKSVDIATGYLGPAESLYPFIQPTGDGGVVGAVDLAVTNVMSTPSAGTRFTVSIVGASPNADLSFTWKAVQ